MNSVCFSPISVQTLTVLVDCWFKIEQFLQKMAISSESWSESSFFQWFSRQFSLSAQALCFLVYSSLHLFISVYLSVQDTTPEGILSSCGCSLTLTLTTSIGVLQDAGDTKSWSSVVSLSCACRISLCHRYNYDFGGWATRIIHSSFWVFSTVSITLIKQETISLATGNHSFRLQIEGRLTFSDMTPFVIRTKCMHLLHRLWTKSTHLGKLKALAVSESSLWFLPKHSKHRRHETITVASTDIL